MSAPVDSVLVDVDGPAPVPNPVTHADLWTGLTVWYSQSYCGDTIHRTPDCPQLCRARAITSERLGDLPEHYRLCRSQDCWPQERYIDQRRTCPYCGERAKKMRYHLPCEEAER